MSGICYVTSDLHLGNGTPADALEDFWQDQAFASWVASIAGPDTTLVLNGDVFECAQLEPVSVAGLPDHLAWDEAASLAKVRTAVRGHPVFFDALASFLEDGSTLVLTIGNHDLDLDVPAVQALLRGRLGDPDETRLSFVVGPYRYGPAYISHGHEFTPENCPHDVMRFRHLYDDGMGERLFLERVWGTDFVLHFFNPLEVRLPFADNVKPTTKVALRGIKDGWVTGADVVRLVAFLARRRLSLATIGSWVLGDQVTNSLSVDEASQTLTFAVDDVEWGAALDEALESTAFRESVAEGFDALDPVSRKALLDAREPVAIEDPPIAPGNTLLLGRGTRELRRAKVLLETPDIGYVVLGHTHHIVDGDLGGKLFNPGTWIPRLNLENPDVARAIDAKGFTTEVLSDPSLYNLMLRAVRIRPDEGLVDLVPIDPDLDAPTVGQGHT
ncbi:MAG: hypothetical protein ACXV8L_07040 [Ilumatobacteraceae bacterium]